jgi:Spy/CpxP family protein refolding chaperone
MSAMHELGKLNLSDAQKDSIKQFAKQGFGQLKPQMEAVRQQRKAFESMDPTSSGYRTATSNLAKAEADFASARVMQRAALRAQVYNLLTPEQRSQLATMRAQREVRMQQRKARMQQWKEFKAEHPLPSSAASAQQ